MRVSPAPPRGPAQARPHNLPAPLTRLIGRAAEVAAVRDALLAPEVRLLTLVGAPGIGKTRLALAVAHALVAGPPAGADSEGGAQPGFADGVAFVPLAPLRDPGLVVPAIAQALGVRDSGDRPVLDGLKVSLRNRQLLLVLDNFEHVLVAAPLVGELLAACPELTVLATSRAPLHVYGEHEYPVAPLALPDLARLDEPAALAGVPAVALLVERAQAVRPEFRLTAENAAAVAAVCVRLDGLPLALELAAARIKLLPPQAILARLGSRLELLTGGARDRPARHQTLRAALAWSHDLLSAEEQWLLRRLAVFSGGCTLAAVAAVCNPDGDPAIDMLDGIAALVDQSLVRAAEPPDGEPRFDMLETVREYALERLERSGELATIRREHAAWCLALAEAVEPELTGADQALWLNRLEAEHANLRTALRWSLEPGDAESGLRLGGALWWFWHIHGHRAEGQQWLADLLDMRGVSEYPSARAKVLSSLGTLTAHSGDYARAHCLHTQSLAIGQELADKRVTARALGGLGYVAHARGDYAVAWSRFQESRRLWRELGDQAGMAESLNNLGWVVQAQGRYDEARALHSQALVLAKEVRDARRIANSLGALGEIAQIRGRHVEARACHEESLAIRRELGDK